MCVCSPCGVSAVVFEHLVTARPGDQDGHFATTRTASATPSAAVSVCCMSGPGNHGRRSEANTIKHAKLFIAPHPRAKPRNPPQTCHFLAAAQTRLMAALSVNRKFPQPTVQHTLQSRRSHRLQFQLRPSHPKRNPHPASASAIQVDKTPVNISSASMGVSGRLLGRCWLSRSSLQQQYPQQHARVGLPRANSAAPASSLKLPYELDVEAQQHPTYPTISSSSDAAVLQLRTAAQQCSAH